MTRVFDLHTHSTCSDGTTSPADNAALAAAAGLSGLALTDHDTVAGWEEAAAACARHGLAFVPGLELSTELDGRSIHLLGYWVDPDHPALQAECDRLRHERQRRAEAMVAKLAALGVDIDMAEVEVRAAGAPIGRPHVAAAMVAAGHVPDLDTAFADYIADNGPAYVPKYALSPEEGTDLLVQAGGVAVLAHPGLCSREAPVDLELLDRLAGAGLAGVEADHAGHEPEVRDFWRAAAAARNLVVTGASDFHGMRKDSKIGEAVSAASAVEDLSKRAGRARHKEAARW